MAYGHNQYIVGVLLATLAACSSSTDHPELQMASPDVASVVNGELVATGSPLSKQVLLLKANSAQEGDSWTCTATALSKRIILTAAHCLPYETQKASVELVDSQSKDTEKAELQAFIRHEAYGLPLDIMRINENDVALAVLKSDLPPSVEITKLYDGKNPFDKNNILIAGYGLTEKDPVVDGTRNPHKGFKISLNVGTTILEESFRTTLHLSSTSKAHGCYGDSGGPAFVRSSNGALQQIGVFSRVSAEDCNEESLYESTLAQSDWLLYNIKKLNFYLKVAPQKTPPVFAQGEAEALDATNAQAMIKKTRQIVSNEYFEYQCAYTEPSERDTSELLEVLLKEIEGASSVKVMKKDGDLQLTFGQKLTTIRLSTAAQQTLIPVMTREIRNSGKVSEQIVCKAEFINIKELE